MFSFTERSLRAAVLELGAEAVGAGFREAGTADSSTGSGSGRLKLKLGVSPVVAVAEAGVG
jgi:hypothetical protein